MHGLGRGPAGAVCLTLAITCEGRDVTTIEGLSAGDELHPVQEAFIDADAFQCGYCTPGQIMSAAALLAEGDTRRREIREWMSGNICRCATYPHIRAAIRPCVTRPGVTDRAAAHLRAGHRRRGSHRDRPRTAAAFLAGGTTEVDLIRQGVAASGCWSTSTRSSWPASRTGRTGAADRRAGPDERRCPGTRGDARFPVISQALLLGASPQLRNMASMGGNLCQRVRCSYFRDGRHRATSGIPAAAAPRWSGFNRGHAILGTSG